MDDTEQLVEDLRFMEKGGLVVHLSFSAGEAMLLVGLLQLAWKHPELPPNCRELADQVGHCLQLALAERAPAIGRVLEQGWQADQRPTKPPANAAEASGPARAGR